MIQLNSIGIIGGADGPTAVYVSGPASWVLPAVIVAALVVAAVAALIYRRKK